MLEGSSSANQLVFNFSHPSNDTFANFIESESSKLALNAARALCGDSRPPFHTLFIIGESGLGKTHLLKAIGSHAKQRGEKVHYINGDLFARSIIKGETDAIEDALSRILHSDYFLLDDVHKISRSPDAQEKLHYIYNQLYPNKKKIAFSSTQSPENLTELKGFLKSRFQWGMIVHLKTIHDKTTSQIIQKIAGDLGLEIPDSIINYLLTHIHRDYPSFRGAIDAINKASCLKKQKVTLPLVKEALGL